MKINCKYICLIALSLICFAPQTIGAYEKTGTVTVKKQLYEINNKAPKQTIDKGNSTTAIAENTYRIDKQNMESPSIRVLLLTTTNEVLISDTSPFAIKKEEGKIWKSASPKEALKLSQRNGYVYVNGDKASPTIWVVPKDEKKSNIVTINGKAYRGGVVATTTLSPGRLAIINKVSLEEYLYGVVPAEAVPSWPKAALEAQAVAARTYALHTMAENKNAFYDVNPDTRHQVYSGVGSEYPSTTQAVEATKGVVMLYQGAPIEALFHADGGGYTANSANVWGNSIPYLKGVSDDYGVSARTTYRWVVQSSKTKLEKILKGAGKDVGDLKEIRLHPLGKRPMAVSDRDASGRIIAATFVGSKKTVTLSGITLQQILGLRSTLFDFYVNQTPPTDVFSAKSTKPYHTFKKDDDPVYIVGYGWGHGLGMSQWGAAEMAKNANSSDAEYYKKILMHYYSGVTIKKWY